VLSDIHGAKHKGVHSPLLGDILCLAGSALYAATNVAQEVLIKRFDRVEYLGMLGLFGALFGGAQAVLLEGNAFSQTDWKSVDILLVAGFVACMVCMYMFGSVLLRISDAALYNLSLLTTNVWAVTIGSFVFGEKPHWTYFVSLFIILIGLSFYHSQKPRVDGVDGVDDVNRCAADLAAAKEWQQLEEEEEALLPS
jgi:solute carrier family 35, member F1/2